MARREGLGRELFAGLLIALAAWLAWQAIKPALAAKLPPLVGVRFDPTSPEALARAAESELAAGRSDQAAVFARASLAGAPFNVPALRVLGLATAATDVTAADRLLTLAGEWSMRDIPTEVWLMQRRLNQGDVVGVVTHADRLGRVREAMHPALFQVFNAIAADPHGAVIVADRLSREPMWRPPYLGTLGQVAGGGAIGANLAVALQRTTTPMTNQELSVTYGRLAAEGRYDALRDLRARLGRPASTPLLADGDFPQRPAAPTPFSWTYESKPGLEVTMAPAPGKSGDDTAMRLDFDGFTPAVAVSQLILAAPGAYRLTGQSRRETFTAVESPTWTVICRGSGVTLATAAPNAGQVWTPFSVDFIVPAQGCAAQELRLVTPGGDRRVDATAWFDNLELAAR